MRHFLYLIMMGLSVQFVHGQTSQFPPLSAATTGYQATSLKTNNLVHTKLEVRFDYTKAWMYGKAWVTLAPHFYPIDSVVLDAKGMEIKEVALVQGNSRKKLQHQYDGMQLFIQLDKMYKKSESYILYIDYIAKPNELKVKGSAAITDAKGLYFINPTGSDPKKPIQIWTQGETEASSVWMPTIDKPNQKTTQEMYMTVPSSYVTLSNGLLVNQKKNTDGTRTDYWKMDLPHAPYLFFMGVGDFAIVKDTYKGKEVSYYVEKKEAPYAKGVFGNTPEMMRFFSEKLGVEYPWQKYAQMVGRDYVSGAMENTTATLHMEKAYQNFRQLTDGNGWEKTIAHELFHQWFGDLVTAESWSNLTVNESFANYSEYLWLEHQYGKEVADEHNVEETMGYLQSNSEQKNLVRFNYADKEDMFDAVSYNKGGRILHMLRNFVGDDAFFKSLNVYLTNNKFKPGEAAQLRLAFEEVTGRDLNWFFNQWYYGNGHPKVDISYRYDEAAKKMHVYIKQTQTGAKVFQLPIAIDIYTGSSSKRSFVWMQHAADTFSFDVPSQPSLVNVDADKVLLWEKTDHKTENEFLFQYKNAPRYLDRKEAIDFFVETKSSNIALGLTDRFAGLRKMTIEAIESLTYADEPANIATIAKIAATEKDKKTKAAALRFLAGKKDAQYNNLFQQNVGDSSYSVAGAALTGLMALQPESAYTLAKKYSDDARGDLGEAVTAALLAKGESSDFEMIADYYSDAPLGQEKLEMTAVFINYLLKLEDTAKIKQGVDHVIKFRNTIPEQYKKMTEPLFKGGLNKLAQTKTGAVADYIREVYK